MKSSDRARFRKDLKRFADNFKNRSSRVLDGIALDVQGEAKQNISRNKTSVTGALSNSITIRKTPLGARRVGTNVGYGLYVEFGRPPGKFPPPDVLERWVKRKLGVSGKAAKGVAFQIAKKISEKGTEAQPFLIPAYNKIKSQMPKKYKHLFR